MFALEITFNDHPSETETILVRRHKALIGSSADAHVEIQDMQSLSYDLRLVRDLGRKFRVSPIPKASNVAFSNVLEGVYDGTAHFDLGRVKLNVTALDSDVMTKDGEPADRAGVRVMRLATSAEGPTFPALVVQGSEPIVMSFSPDMPVYIGSSKGCALRLDVSDISPKHARIGFESGEFWVEDIGSKHGTFVNNAQISGRVNVRSGAVIGLGKTTSIIGITSEDQLALVATQPGHNLRPAEERRYPVLVSVSEVARPARLVIPIDGSVTLGRDPSSDMWLGAPHISRRHSAFTLNKTGNVSVTDYSKNGTAYDGGILKRGDLVQMQERAHVFDFGGDITVAVCFNEEQEQQFLDSGGDPQVFRHLNSSEDISMPQPGTVRSVSAPKLSASVMRRPKASSPSGEALSKFILFYQSLSRRNKIALYITGAAVVVVGVVLLNLLLRLNF